MILLYYEGETSEKENTKPKLKAHVRLKLKAGISKFLIKADEKLDKSFVKQFDLRNKLYFSKLFIQLILSLIR